MGVKGVGHHALQIPEQCSHAHSSLHYCHILKLSFCCRNLNTITTKKVINLKSTEWYKKLQSLPNGMTTLGVSYLYTLC